jgi:hypothetical protein
MAVQITCIKKSGGYHENPHEAISTFGWKNDETGQTGDSDREETWKWVTGGGYAYVKDADGNKATVRAKTNSLGTHYLQTEADGKPTDNLLKLPEC